jgi:hypothetical protein
MYGRAVIMHDLIPVTVIEHQGPFPPSMQGVYLTYQGQSLEQAAAEFIRRTKTKPSIIYMDAKRQTVWIPYTGWTPKEQE